MKTKNNTNNYIKYIETLIEEKSKETQTLKREYELKKQDINITSLLLNVLKKLQDSKNQSFNISSYQEHRFVQYYVTNKENINEFINLFSNNECLKLNSIPKPSDYESKKDLIFLLDNYTMLIISFRKNYYIKEGNLIISATIKPITFCKGDNFVSKIHHRDPFLCKQWDEDIEAFAFRDQSNNILTNDYKVTDSTKSYQNIDIREILEIISLEEIIERIINRENLTKKKTKRKLLIPKK